MVAPMEEARTKMLDALSMVASLSTVPARCFCLPTPLPFYLPN